MLLPDFVAVVFVVIFGSGVAHAFGNQASAPIQTPLPVSQPQKDTLIVGSEQDYPPFTTDMTDAMASGFTVDLWKAVAAESGLNYRIHVGPFREILQQFKDGKIDVLINLAQSEERHHFADFPFPMSLSTVQYSCARASLASARKMTSPANLSSS